VCAHASSSIIILIIIILVIITILHGYVCDVWAEINNININKN
jgi:hypothetical protein